ncbi:MAG: hypothetical protein ACE5GD_01885 [Candidatus Geothermarchaeales archaeon]
MKKYLALFLIALVLTLGSAYYSNYLRKSEIVHFWVVFPAGEINTTKTIFTPRGPTTLKPLIIGYSEQGIFKRLLNPWVIALSTHWILNIDNQPHRVRLELVNCTMPVEWKVGAGIPYDPETKTFTTPLKPRQMIPNLRVDWHFFIPENIRYTNVWYDGGLAVIDADTGETLTFQPIKIMAVGAGAEAECH